MAITVHDITAVRGEQQIGRGKNFPEGIAAESGFAEIDNHTVTKRSMVSPLSVGRNDF